MGAGQHELLVERDGHVAVMTMNRPERLNAIDTEQIERLEAAWLELDADPDVRVIVFTGAGRGFCGGADLVARANGASATRSVGSDANPDDIYPHPRRGGGQIGFTARHCKVYKPVITAVNGVCAGAGLHFVADSDIVICSSNATFVDTHVNVGQITALEPIGLARRIPLGVVLRMVCLGKHERIDAKRALEIGMITEIVDDPVALVPRAMELAELVATASPDTLRISLQSIWEGLDVGLQEAYLNGFRRVVGHWSHPDAIEGPKAFTEKREPQWTVLAGDNPGRSAPIHNAELHNGQLT
jgi:enoyl-CoA hydratase